MTTTPTFFVVEETPTGEQPAIYYDDPPQVKTTKTAKILYIVRMDQLPNAKTWLAMDLKDLYAAYCAARDGKTLPPQFVEPKMADTNEPRVRLGHREELPWTRRQKALARKTQNGPAGTSS